MDYSSEELEVKVLEKFDSHLPIDLIAWQLDISYKRVEGILKSFGRI